MTEVVSAVHCDVTVATAVASMAEEINLLNIAAVNRVTPVLQGSTATQIVVCATFQLDLADEVMVAVQGNAEVLPVTAQLLAVNVDLTVAQHDAALGTMLVIDNSGTICVATGTQDMAQVLDLIVVRGVKGVAPGPQGIVAAEVVVVMVLLLDPVDECIATAQSSADQLPVSDLVTDKAQCVVT